ncbi:UvrD-helicase domain-containing protein [bacterium]|nr:UvrD-helicase domain-containing protein [bacterium]
MPCDNIALIAAAGSGKTTYIVDEVTGNTTDKILLVTYTIANTRKLKKDIEAKMGIVPSNVEIMTWHSFLLQHCIRPFRSVAYNKRIERIDFDTQITNHRIPERNTRAFYFSAYNALYKDRATKFALKCNDLSNNAVVERLEEIYSLIYIDEVQDMAGDDLDLLALLCTSKIKIVAVGDIRQAIYFTCNAPKNKGNRGSKLLDYFRKLEKKGLLTVKFRDYSYRCKQCICDLSDSLFPSIDERTKSLNDEKCDHEGLYIVKTKDFDTYVGKYNPAVLRWSVTSKIPQTCYPVDIKNIGVSKGSTHNHVIIICTEPFKKFVKSGTIPTSEKTKSELYVAITRARYSVAFVYDETTYMDCFTMYKGE